MLSDLFIELGSYILIKIYNLYNIAINQLYLVQSRF